MARKSSIQQLPPDILDRLQELLRDPSVNQLEVTKQINKLLESLGYEQRVSKSAVGRYSQRMEKVGARIQRSREMAQMWIAKFGAAPQGEVGKLLNETIREMSLNTAMVLADSDDEEPVPPKVLASLALAVQRLEAAANMNVKRDVEIKRQAKEEALEQAAKTAKRNGVSDETIALIRRDVLGMAE